MASWSSSESRLIGDDDLLSEYYKELLCGMYQKHKRLKKNVDYEQLIDVLAMDKSMLEEELSVTKSKLKLYDSHSHLVQPSTTFPHKAYRSPIPLHQETVIMEPIMKKKQKGAILELKRRHLKNTIFCTYTPYPAMKIRRISVSSAQETRNDQFPIWHNTIYGMNGEDVTYHITRVLEITEWIKIPNVEKNVLRLHVFSKSLSGDAEKCNSKVPDDLDNGTDYLEFFHWLALKFNNYWELDKNTQNGLLEFYVNEHTKGAKGDLDDEPRNESYKEECSDTFYKLYLDTQDTKDIYKIIDREYTLIPILAPRDIDNPGELCKTKEFIVVRHSIGNDEGFVTISPSKICVVEKTPGSMSCIYHELFSRKDRGWEVTRTK
ncbi:hypothetical protein Tco_0162274 [Tanacetum coccineum]